MKKGFTLIELLAVIVILAIIALIAIPVITDVIETAKRGAAENSALGYIGAVEKQIMVNKVDKSKTNIADNTYTVSELDGYSVKVKGDKPSNDSWVTIVKGQVTSCSLKINDYIINCMEKGKVKGEKGNVVTLADTIGRLIYFDPASEATCNDDSESSTCYKWRIIGTDDEEGTITLQMDHNLINKIAWGPSDNSTGPVTALEALNIETASWTRVANLNYEYNTETATSNYGKMICTNGICTLNGVTVAGTAKARMITGEEVSAITNTIVTDENATSKNWTLANSNSYCFSRTDHLIGTNSGGSGNTKLAWLVENTIEVSGCGDTIRAGATNNVYGESNYGYWTLSPYSNYYYSAWGVSSYGSLTENSVDHYSYGVRPVITIPRSSI